MFASVEVVVGAYGAGLTNVVFLPAGAGVIERLHHRYGTKSYSPIAMNADLRYCYLPCAGHQGDVVSASAGEPDRP